MLDVPRSLTDFQSAETLDQLKQHLHRIALELGFRGFNYVEARLPSDDLPFSIGTVDKQWEIEYIRGKFYYHDPVIIKARQSNLPFTWSHVNQALGREGPRSPFKKTMNAAREFGFSDGLNIPHHYRDHRGRLCSSCVCFFYKDKLTRFIHIFNNHAVQLRVIMIYWAAQVEAVRSAHHVRPRNIVPTEGLPKLSGREQDVLVWAALGKTIAETAIILSLSDATVVTHIKNAIVKLGAVNKVQAVVHALRLGIIEL